jgi:beta-N-acetylhexosaminidase
MRANRLFSALMLLILVASLMGSVVFPPVSVMAQTATPPPAVGALLESMTPEERVGQLFLVTFTGTDVGTNSQIYDLIVNHNVGGVVMAAANDNFSAAPDTLANTFQMIGDLQRAEWNSSLLPYIDPKTNNPLQRNYVPLFIGIAQDGDGPPYDQIINDLTPLPNEMALGATWNPDLAEQTGNILGQELSALGFNLFMGPSLDVLETPNPSGGGDLGTRVFGGDPYWVGKMGQAYISGLHSGSSGKLLVIAKHFPGRGSSDRLPEEEVATVRKSLEQMKQIELPPFFAVTGNAPSPQAKVDGLLVSHIRYQGFQGNIRASTRPISFDPQALAQILALPQFASWRENGGLIVSDDLGSQAVRQFYDPSGFNFQARLVALNAFLAGNDMLYLGNIRSSEDPDSYTTVLRVLDYFAQKYREDPAFAQRVNAAVERILQAKYGMYRDLSLPYILPQTDYKSVVNQTSQIPFEIARQAASLISPDLRELDTVLPGPPDYRDNIIFITDVQTARQCSTCTEQPIISQTEFQDVVLRLYGPSAGGQVFINHLFSHSFDDLKVMLDGGDTTLLDDLRRSDWVILSLAGTDKDQPITIQRFLSEHQDLLRDKHVILFSFSAPYYLDATDISKLTAYYDLYSKEPPFVDVAARLLYRELTPKGASPVSVPGIGYDLITATSPDPGQTISLFADIPLPSTPESLTTTPEPTAVPFYNVGDTVAVRTGEILDHNGNSVPDGTVVRFTMTLTGENGGILQQVDANTTDGIAHASFRLDKTGMIEIRASSEPATVSDIVQLDVTSGEAAAMTVIAPVPTQTPLFEITPTPISQESGLFSIKGGHPPFSVWILVVIVLILGTWFAYRIGSQIHNRRWGLRWALSVLLGGLIAYNYLALGFPGSTAWVTASGTWGVLGWTILGEMLGWIGSWIWTQRASD